MRPDFLDDLQARGLIHQMSDPALADVLRGRRMTGYIGFDPTADSLHVGSLMQLMTLKRFQLAGHRPIALLGGATGLIGDPSGKSAERGMLSLDELEKNVAGIRAQVERFLNFNDGDALLLNNADWLGRLNLVDFLRDVGKHFSVNVMITRDSVRTRLETREHGISYTEFSYMLLQSYDFLWLFDHYGCALQMGGSDQWGNILSGADLIRRLRSADAFGVTTTLITRADGGKFGKTEEGNVWLDPARTSPYHFYQFWLNVDDKDVQHYLNSFTLLPLQRIRELADAVQTAPAQREAQRVLAEEVTRQVHGPAALNRAQRATAVLFDKNADFRLLSEQELAEAFQGAPQTQLDPAALGTPAAGLVALLADAGLYPSRGQARKDLPNGSVSINGTSISDVNYVLSDKDVLPGGFVILRKGRKHYHVLRVTA